MADDLQAALAPEIPATPSQSTTPAAADQVQSSPSEPTPKLSFRDALTSNLEKAEAKISKPQDGPGQTPQAAPKSLESTPVANQTQVAPTQHAPILPPSDMNADEKAAFQSGDPIGLQKYHARRSYEMRTDYKRQTMELDARRKNVEAFEKVIERNKDHYMLQGQDQAQVFERALAWDRRIKEEPVSGALEYLKAYGISPQDLLKAAQGRPQEPVAQQQSYGAEDIQQMIEERLQARIEEAEKQATMQKLSSAVDKFISSKPVLADPGTQDAVTRAMAPYAQAAFASDPSVDPEKVLESVYKFVLAEQFPDLHSRLQARSVADAKNSEASKAKQAGKSISGSLSSGEPKRKFKNFRDALEAHMR